MTGLNVAGISKASSCKYTAFFENEVLRKRPYLKKNWCIQVIEDPIKMERQEDNQYIFWGKLLNLIIRICAL